MPNEPHKPRFEPPPWEREAFERFQQEREQHRVGTGEPGAAEPQSAGAAPGAAAAQETSVPLGLLVPEVRPSSPETAGESRQNADQPLSDAHIDSMLIKLRSEEPRAAATNIVLVNVVSGLLGALGLVVVVQSVLLFARVRATEAATVLLAGTMSFVVFLSGLGLLAVAWMLFRKYHR